jgi:hypothetical protein
MMEQPAEDTWATLSWEDRHDQMTFEVLPSMAELFQTFDGAPYPELTCRTCHGKDAEEVHYKMPHGLPPLDPAHMPEPGTHDRTARLTRFMIEEVLPKMVALLDTRPYDPVTKRGFGCFKCHPTTSGSDP